MIFLKIGPRIVKTGIAVTLALYICRFFELEPGVFAGVAAIFAVQPSIYRTWRHLLDQLLTNTLGATIALLTIYFIGNEPIIIGLVMMIVILIGLQLKMVNTISLTLVTVLAIMSAPGTEDLLYAANRFLIILIGIGSAFLVNIFIIPPNHKKIYLENSSHIFQNMSILMRTAISDELTEKSFQEEFKNLNQDLQKLEETFNIFNEERAKLSKFNQLDSREVVVFKQMLRCLQQGEEVLLIIDEHYFQSKRNEDVNQFFDSQLEELIRNHEYLLLKYEGKTKQGEGNLGHHLLTESSHFLEQLLRLEVADREDRQRLIMVGSSIFEYVIHLQRLNRVIDQYLKTA